MRRIAQPLTAGAVGLFVFLASGRALPAFASPLHSPLARRLALAGGRVSSAAGSVSATPQRLALDSMTWLALFLLSAAFHAAEKAVDNLYPWKIKEFAEEEGPTSPFAKLMNDILGFQFAILVTTTACTIFSAGLFANVMLMAFGPKSVTYASGVLTLLTVFFAELLPKALGVSQPEVVARSMVGPVILISSVLRPISGLFTRASTLILQLFRLDPKKGDGVSEEMLRLMILGAKESGGIQMEEGSMMESVLKLEDKKVNEVMRPRVDVVAIDRRRKLKELLQLAYETRCSRIPVYDGEIDQIVGVVKLKNVLRYLNDPRNLETATVEAIMHPERDKPYFFYEMMAAWDVLQEMRRHRFHMGIVVDEHGGTAGIVTLEDILEEVVGDIYDEDDEEDFREEDDMIIHNEAEHYYEISGAADLRAVEKFLGLDIDEESLSSFNSLSGYLCDEAGRIPDKGDYLLIGSYSFKVIDADDKRVLRLRVESIGDMDDEEGPEAERDQADSSRLTAVETDEAMAVPHPITI
ncbi:unnamed protein product [Vitrella brassicaformis CCMP3155]|uniref:CNNM transmembrane domain-containing protein n=2 Tax=Vitrella brassicaformis TaxID=1169539 RepID=A0A0G4GVS8_VITBC|nr:unnamed protein product [Vitrella brassicaformis CCMP3155]|eukprot:CEM35031.1 unnamed protein product [Vitrella brassicaformis CCMP3155]